MMAGARAPVPSQQPVDNDPGRSNPSRPGVRNVDDNNTLSNPSHMPYQWRVNKSARLGFGRLDGVVSGADVLSASDAFFGDPEWQPGYRLLWDNRAIKKLAITPGDAARILKRAVTVPSYLGEGKAAAVISEDLRMIGEHLISMSGLDPDRVRLFGSMERALEWLEVNEYDLTQIPA
jgi:hypothetical protein